MTDLPEKHHAAVVEQTEALIELFHKNTAIVFAALADRPKPGDKKRGRDAFLEILNMKHEMWRFMEGKKPLIITNGDEQRME